jgi:hypothetical protein
VSTSHVHCPYNSVPNHSILHGKCAVVTIREASNQVQRYAYIYSGMLTLGCRCPRLPGPHNRLLMVHLHSSRYMPHSS